MTKKIYLFILLTISILSVKAQEADSLIHVGYNLTTTKGKSTLSVSTITANDISASGQLNPENALYGMLPGLMVQQNWTLPSNEGPVFKLRGNTPLILVDGFERPMNTLSREEIESVSVLKDAAALALYGMRGANGIILITTKRGGTKPIEVRINYQHGMTTPIRLPQMADAPTYAMALNEALRNDGLANRYSDADIADFRSGAHPYLYPNVNWMGEALRKQGSTNELNMSFKGGAKRIRYYVLANYQNNSGFLDNTDLNEGYSTQVADYKLNFRTNLDIEITNTTQLKLNLLGRLSQYNTINGMDNLLSTLYTIPSTAFPIRSENNIWSENATWHNPIAQMSSTGFTQVQDRALFADMSLTQDLSVITPGLSAELSIGYDNRAAYEDKKSKNYAYEEVIPKRGPDGEISSVVHQYGNETNLKFDHKLSSQSMLTTLRAKVNYFTSFENQELGASLIYDQFKYIYTGRNSTRLGQSVIANVNYGLYDKYLFNLATSYSGYSTMPKGNKFRVFPALSAAWVISNESFLQNATIINSLKLRASWGMTGYAAHGYELDQQFYNLNGGNGYNFGNNLIWNNGSSEGALPVKGLTSETSYKSNVGIEMGLFNRFMLEADIFYDRRADILVSSAGNISTVLGITPPQTNAGINDYYGAEISLGWNDKIGNDFNYFIRGNLSLLRTKIVEMNEEYKTEEYLRMTNRPIGQYSGLEGIGFFNDENDIKNSPKQAFSDVKPGDIKYRDQNGDGLINEYDKISMGYSTQLPEIYYGFGLGFEYKGFGVHADFQGLANYTVTTQVSSVYWPLYGNNKTVSTHYLENRWTPESKDARYPRLTTLANENNFRNNSIWMENGAYLKLRNIELFYNLPASTCKVLFLSDIKVFVKGKDLFTKDHVKVMDPEMVSAYYPTSKAYLIGINIEF